MPSADSLHRLLRPSSREWRRTRGVSRSVGSHGITSSHSSLEQPTVRCRLKRSLGGQEPSDCYQPLAAGGRFLVNRSGSSNSNVNPCSRRANLTTFVSASFFLPHSSSLRGPAGRDLWWRERHRNRNEHQKVRNETGLSLQNMPKLLTAISLERARLQVAPAGPAV